MARLTPRALEILLLFYKHEYSNAQIEAGHVAGRDCGDAVSHSCAPAGTAATGRREGRETMSRTDRGLKELIDRHLKWPSDLAYIAARDRVREELLSTPSHLLAPRIAGAPPPILARRMTTVAAVAAVVALAVGAGILWPRGPQRFTAGAAGTQVTLSDGSQIEMRANAELTVEREEDGLGIRLHQGDIIVTAAKQRDGHLYVHTTDMTIAVVGTVFLVNAGSDGSRVAVIEGEVRVREGGVETRLRPGEQVASSPTIARRPVAEDIDWSRNANVRQTVLELFMKGIAQTAGTLQPLNQGQAPAQAGPARLEFEEASVRECDPDNMPPAPAGARGGGPNSLYMTPGRLHALCLTLATLVRTAYGYGPMDLEVMNTSENTRRRPERNMRFEAVYGLGVEDGRRVRGGPEWVHSEHYTVEAVAPGAADANTMRGPMLQALLERRFQLRVHIDAEQVPAFALTVAPSGLKVKPMQPGDCRTEPIPEAVRAERERKDWGGPVLITEAAYFGIKPNCGFVYGEQNGPNFRIEAANSPGRVPIGGALGARVVDRTGITGNFLYTFEFGPDETTPGAARMMVERDWTPKPGFDAPATHPRAAPLARALEEQLGLRLEPIRLPREFVVIDRVERPEPN